MYPIASKSIHQEIINTLHENGFEVFIVGGFVRDTLLGLEPFDMDFATNAKPEEIKKLFTSKNMKVSLVGQQFKVSLVNGIEVATFREDKQTKLFKARYCEPEYADTIEEDLARRDLTINAMAVNAITKEFIDPFNGSQDLVDGIIRFVGNGRNRVQQDPTRILRACRFLAQIEGSFSHDTLKVLLECAPYVKKHIEPDRIRLEILKAMKANQPSIFFSALHLIDALKYIFPSMDLCFGHTGGKHHPETIGEHLMQTGDNISKKFPLVRLAGYLHDIGKPSAYEQNGDGSFNNHELIGMKLTEKYLRKLRFSNYEIATVKNLVSAHMRTCLGLTPRGIRRLKKYLADIAIDPRSYIRLKLADRLANMDRTPTEIAPVRGMIINSGIREVEENLPLTLKDLTLSGGDLIKEFGLHPGPVVGVLHKRLLEFVVDEGEEFNTYKALVKQARVYLAEIS
jgi:putative nucleotidyltransferase with HDIG domain